MKWYVLVFAVGVVGCKGDAAKYVGTWKCQGTIKEIQDGQELRMEMKYNLNVLENGRQTSDGTVTLHMPVPDQPGLSVKAQWTILAAGTYEFTGGKLCKTMTDVKMVPDDEPARMMEKEMGRGLESLLPKGSADCSVYELTDQRIVVTSKDAGDMTCMR